MPGLSCSALARQIGVSRQGVHQAVKRGVLRRGAEGLIDPSIEPNKSWIGLHAQGFDWRGRDMRSYARATRTNPQSVPPKVGETVELDIHDEAALDKFLKEGLAEFERTRMTDAELNALFDEITADQSAREDRIVRAVNELRQMVDGLRRDLHAWRPTHEPGLRHTVEQGFAGVKLNLSVAFHQFARLLRGEGLTVSEEAFGPVDPALRDPAPAKPRA